MQLDQAKWAALLLSASLLYACILQLVTNEQPKPYMDEPFHVGQTQKYCHGDWSSWDPKITTLPGLYLLAWVYVQLTSIMTATPVVELCEVGVLRSLNCVLVPGFLILVHSLHTRIHGPHNPHALSALIAAMLALFPFNFFFSFLYYTDVGSTVFVLLCQYLAQTEWFVAAGAAGAAAVLFRQTNAVWVTFITAASMLQYCSKVQAKVNEHLLPDDDDRTHPDQMPHDKGTPTDPGVRGGDVDVGEESLVDEVKRVLTVLLTNLPAVLSNFWPLLLVPLGFGVFVVVNKGIVVGDRSAHTPVKHWAQALYFCLYTATVFAPATLSHLRSLTRSFLSHPASSSFILVSGVAASLAAIHYGTLAHPYLLADNRHYTFYIWRKVLARHWVVKFALAPVYTVCAWLLWAALGAGGASRLWRLGFAACVMATVVPAWLVEFRYFTVPAMIFALHMQVPSCKQVALTLAGFALVNALTLYLFLYKPYTWPDGSVARFMW